MSWVTVKCPIDAGLHQNEMYWYLVITASSYKVAVRIMSPINYITHQYTNATENTPHKTTQTPHKTSAGDGMQSLIALFLVCFSKGARSTGSSWH